MDANRFPVEELDSRITAIEEAFPFPKKEIERLSQRKWILSFFKPGGIGAEIGVFRGHFSEMMLELLKPKRMYLVDPWTKSGETYGDWGEYTNFGTLETSAARDEAIMRARRACGADITVIEDFFPASKDGIVDRLDWVYLDASHSYEGTLRELVNLPEHLSDDAVIAGDDWRVDPQHKHFGVFSAVNDFVRQSDWNIVACAPGSGQWVIRRY